MVPDSHFCYCLEFVRGKTEQVRKSEILFQVLMSMHLSFVIDTSILFQVELQSRWCFLTYIIQSEVVNMEVAHLDSHQCFLSEVIVSTKSREL